MYCLSVIIQNFHQIKGNLTQHYFHMIYKETYNVLNTKYMQIGEQQTYLHLQLHTHIHTSVLVCMNLRKNLTTVCTYVGTCIRTMPYIRTYRCIYIIFFLMNTYIRMYCTHMYIRKYTHVPIHQLPIHYCMTH